MSMEPPHTDERHRPFLRELDEVLYKKDVRWVPSGGEKRPCILKFFDINEFGVKISRAIREHGYYVVGIKKQSDYHLVHITERP